MGVVRNPDKAAWLAERGVQLRKADLLDRSSLQLAFKDVDAIVSNAALFTMQPTRYRDFLGPNLQGTANVFHAAAAASVERVVQVSTVGVYRRRLCRTMAEDGAQLRQRDRFTRWGYAVTKAMSEQLAWQLATQFDMRLTVIRPGPIYGPRDTQWTAMVQRWMTWPLLFAPSFRVPLVHAGDVASAISAALQNDTTEGQAYNVTGELLSIGEFLRTWKRVAGQGPLLLPLPLPGWVDYSTEAARRDLGFSNRSLEEGLKDTLSASQTR